MFVSVGEILQLIQLIHDQYETFKGNDLIYECVLYRVENLKMVLKDNEAKFPPELPCLSRVKNTLVNTLRTLENFKKMGFMSQFFLAKNYKNDFTLLNKELTESLNDLHFVLTATRRDEIDPKLIAEEIYSRLLNTLPDFVCSNVIRISEFVDMSPTDQNALIDMMIEKNSSLEKAPILSILQQMKEQKAMNPAAFQRSATQKLSTAFSVKAGPPLPGGAITPVDVSSRIGEGTFGNVYKGSLTSSGEAIAVKYIQVLSQNDKKMFEREIGSLKRLSACPFVIKYLGWIDSTLEPVTQKTSVAIVLEYCPRSLSTIVLDFDYEPPLSEWVRYLHQITVGMRHLSLMGVVHRDLKPDNILITARNEVAITDFGLSITKSSIQRMTASQKLAVAGTMGYMAPEEEASEFSDVFAFGVIMSFVLNRAEPWVDNRGNPLTGSYLQEATRTRPPRLATKDNFPECSEVFLGLAARCCAKAPSLRPRFIEIEKITTRELGGLEGVKCISTGLAETVIATKVTEVVVDAIRMVELGNSCKANQNYAEAVRWYRQAVEKGDGGAMTNLGLCYHNGQGVAQDYAEAVRWLRRGAEKGNDVAMYGLGVCYNHGQGVRQDYVEAMRWYRQAVAKGYAAAMLNLGVCYYNGQGVAQNYAEAARWYGQAAEKGDAGAMNWLGICYQNGQGVTQDYAEALRLYRQAAEKGISRAMTNLGVCYERGQGVRQDYAEAVRWYRRGAEKEEASALLKLGACYHSGQGVAQDYAAAVRWYRKAAEKGDAGAMNNLGFCYEKGQGVAQDYAEAVRWYRQGAEKGDAGAMGNLGLSYYKGHGVAQDYAEAVRWYRQGAEKGDGGAMTNLGVCYYNGQGVAQDYAEAVRWYRQAAEKAYAFAMHGLGACYSNGHGVVQDYAEAVRWYRQAADRGDATAMYSLGACYYNGKDYVEAVKWFRQGAEKGDVSAMLNLGVSCEHGLGVAQDYAEAVRWYRQASEKGNAAAMYNLGVCYHNALGVAQDYAEAVRWYRQGAEKGYAAAMYNIGFCYQNGQGVAKDYAEAKKWYKLSADNGNAKAPEALDKLKPSLGKWFGF